MQYLLVQWNLELTAPNCGVPYVHTDMRSHARCGASMSSLRSEYLWLSPGVVHALMHNMLRLDAHHII